MLLALAPNAVRSISKSYMPADGISAADGRMATSTRRYFFGSSRTNGKSCSPRHKRPVYHDGRMIRIGTSEQNCSLAGKMSHGFWTASWRLVAFLSGAMALNGGGRFGTAQTLAAVR